MRSLGFRTDLLALSGLAEVERHPDHVVIRTPQEPDYWSGNGLILLGPPGDPEEETALFHRRFPTAEHVSIAWDVPDLDPDEVRPLWEPRGFAVEVSDVLARTGVPPASDLPPDAELRELRRDADWDDVLALGLELAAEDGLDLARHEPFLRRRLSGQRAQAGRGLARWWGAFAGGRLAASLGVVQGEGLARYQTVQTAPAQRRRGLASALIRRAAEAALKRDPEARLVLVAETGGAPGRLYRRAGFDLAERTVAVLRRGY
ncbi:GNAT family N-acetyltransferase [Rubellimicrobium roseum]|uniref:GNAT family N-acetyltransferase n=1 Tax=Rubellimicrobium roseum TaxID=687525 RepID=A0A5C4NHH4_9RHOB|nr:GNAT family N-acetyltransferase [Rubellimicrobium roseum]TNC74274.1 GNAT family N-acetyltransferase [Rubellimicrobium roseum]